MNEVNEMDSLDAREQMKQIIGKLIALSRTDEAKKVTADIETLTGAAHQLAFEITNRLEDAESKSQKNSKKPQKKPQHKIPPPSQPLPQKSAPKASSTTKNDNAKKNGQSDLQQSKIQNVNAAREKVLRDVAQSQKRPTQQAQKQALLKQTYGMPSSERSFQKAANILTK
jgi:hypothetical protein